jgi:hypothetical protein
MSYADDFTLGRPGTPGGEQRMIERNQFLEPPPVVRPNPRIPDVPVVPGTPQVPSRPRVRRSLTGVDFTISGVVFLIAWIALAAASSVDGWGAVAFAAFAAAVAGMWWRMLVVIVVVLLAGGVLISVLS